MSQSYRSRSFSSRNPRKKSGGGRIIVLLVVLGLLIGAGAGVIAILNSGGGQVNNPGATATHKGDMAILDSNAFYDGVYVDDVALGGLTMEEARRQIEAKQKEFAANTAVTVAKDTESWQFKVEETACSFDTDAILESAWKQGREGTDEERMAAIEQLKLSPVKLVTTPTIDPSALEPQVRELAVPYTKAPVDAAFLGYDLEKPAGERLSFSPDTPGEQVDADALWAAVRKAFEDKTFGTVQMQVVSVPATITLASLQSEMQLIGQYTTEIRNYTKPRRKNIELANACVSGKFLMPGETFSFNNATGERTAAKGYEKAPVDNNGIEDVGLAGGVCQVSGTLYNAFMCVGPNKIEIVERNHHSIASAYMGLGYDATVDYGNKDLQIKNISDKPMLMIIYYDYDKSRKGYDYLEHAEIYGVPEPDGSTYKLYCKKVRTIPALEGYRTVVSSALQPGETKVFKAHEGAEVNRYWRKIAADGTETDTLINKDTYKADCEVIAHYKDDAPPTPTPSATATPTIDPAAATPTPTPAEQTQSPTAAPTTPPPTEAPAA